MSNLAKIKTEIEDSYKKAKSQNEKSVADYLKGLKESYNKQLNTYKKQTEQQKAAVPRNYTDDYDLNAINKLINQRKLKEKMANLGLTQSGVNQTLKVGLDIAKQNADKTVTMQKNKELSDIDNAFKKYSDSLEADYNSKKDSAQKSLKDKNASLLSNLTAKYNAAVKAELDKKEKEEKEKQKAKEEKEKQKAKENSKKANNKTATTSQLITIYNKLINMNSPRQQMFYMDALKDDGVLSSTQYKRLKQNLGLNDYY